MRNGKLAAMLCVVSICVAAGAVNAQTETKAAASTVEQKRVDAEREAAKQAAFEKALPARLTLVDSIIKQYSREILADAVHGPERLANFAAQVHQTSSEVLSAARSAGTVADFARLIERLPSDPAFKTKAALGDQVNLVFQPMGPCRIADSRTSTLGALQTNVARGYKNFSAAGQGGDGTCNIGPAAGILSGTPGAVALNVTVTAASFPGFVALRPVGSTNTTSTLNFNAGQTLANAAVSKMTGGGGGTNDFEILPVMGAGQTVHVILDLLGFYVASEPAALDCVDTALATSTNVTLGFHSVTPPACAAGFTETGIFCSLLESTGADLQSVGFGSSHNCEWEQTVAASRTIQARSRCCRVPGNSTGRF